MKTLLINNRFTVKTLSELQKSHTNKDLITSELARVQDHENTLSIRSLMLLANLITSEVEYKTISLYVLSMQSLQLIIICILAHGTMCTNPEVRYLNN